MKRYVTFLVVLLVIFILFDILWFRIGLFIPISKENKIISYTTEDRIVVNNDENFTIKGVRIAGSIPGVYITQNGVSYKTYYTWFEQISDMGANTVYIDTIFSKNFYNAFYDYNKKHDKKLYLIHAVDLKMDATNSSKDGFSDEIKGKLISRAQDVVDVVHGRKKITMSEVGSGTFLKDISNYVIGYIISEGFDDTLVAYTDANHDYMKDYHGNLISTKEGSPFEIMLAEVMDNMLSYESRKYHDLHSISFTNDVSNDPIAPNPLVIREYDEKRNETQDYLTPDTLANYFHKIAKIDIEHFRTNNNYNGLFASYSVSSFDSIYLKYLKEKPEDPYYSYLEELNQYHSVPVLVSSFSYSTSKGADSTYENIMYGGLTEEEHGERLVADYQKIMTAGSTGAIINSWQDDWAKSSSNTFERVYLDRLVSWHDYLSSGANTGLLSFDTGKEESVSYVDGSVKEWKKKDIVSDQEDLTLSVKKDEAFVYFYINLKNNTDKVYLALDTTNNSGADSAEGYDLSFERPADFLLVIDGEKAQLLVQEYYNATKAVDGYEWLNINSYINAPKKDSTKFDKIFYVVDPYSKSEFKLHYQESITYTFEELEYGNSNPSSPNYNSLADYYRNNNKIEVRIPWGLLNFYDPTMMEIHDDYYKYYGIKNKYVSKLYVGATTGNDISFNSFNLNLWQNPKYHERLKKSYYIVKKEWEK